MTLTAAARARIQELLDEIKDMPKDRATKNPILRAERARRVADLVLAAHGLLQELHELLRTTLGDNWRDHFLDHELALLEPTDTEHDTTDEHDTDEHDDHETTTDRTDEHESNDERTDENNENENHENDTAPKRTGALEAFLQASTDTRNDTRHEPTDTTENDTDEPSAWDTLHHHVIPPALRNETTNTTAHADTTDDKKGKNLSPREGHHREALKEAKPEHDERDESDHHDDESDDERSKREEHHDNESSREARRPSSLRDGVSPEGRRPLSHTELLLATTNIHLDNFDADTDLHELTERHDIIKRATDLDPKTAKATYTALQHVKRMGLDGIDLRGLLRYANTTKINVPFLRALARTGYIQIDADPAIIARITTKRQLHAARKNRTRLLTAPKPFAITRTITRFHVNTARRNRTRLLTAPKRLTVSKFRHARKNKDTTEDTDGNEHVSKPRAPRKNKDETKAAKDNDSVSEFHAARKNKDEPAATEKTPAVSKSHAARENKDATEDTSENEHVSESNDTDTIIRILYRAVKLTEKEKFIAGGDVKDKVPKVFGEEPTARLYFIPIRFVKRAIQEVLSFLTTTRRNRSSTIAPIHRHSHLTSPSPHPLILTPLSPHLSILLHHSVMRSRPKGEDHPHHHLSHHRPPVISMKNRR